ncbi:hypothetical protein CVT26_007057 [Gymnopilus dilepis]|uniref:Small ribosomal subunit protein bS18m n=1 Tax=Gymnopilus dilepis TaxID=231916 RepID=A0A409VNH9_9AGAR|nr:hypothetical protein CVT26_007057 [Gymnopilus dilepis]
MFAARLRQACSRSYATGPPKTAGWVGDLHGILDKTAKEIQNAPKPIRRTNTLNYRLFHPDQVLTERALQYESCSKASSPRSRRPVAPSAALARRNDIFHQLQLDPRDFSTNRVVLSHFVTEMGKIKSRYETKLTVKNQRLLGRTIRRAKMMGVIPMLSKY